MFLARTRELKAMEDVAKENSLALCVIQGDHGLGKTALVREFLKNKKGIYYKIRRVIEIFNEKLFLQEA